MKNSYGTRGLWYEIEIATTAEGVDIAAALLTRSGCRSCELRERAVVVYHRCDNEQSAYERARELASSISAWAEGAPRVTHVPEQTWTEIWKSHFPRLRIGRRLEVIPPWEDAAAAEHGRVPIIIHPAMAFGTGHHETTHRCLEVLDDIVTGGERVADIGCGTGVLAIAAVRLGAARAIAVDDDPEAVSAAIENCATNGVGDRVDVRLGNGPPAPADEVGFDMVFANIYAETLVAMHERLTSCVKPGGKLVLSGIEGSRRSLIEESFIDDIWSPARIVEVGNWLTLCLQRGAGTDQRRRPTAPHEQQ